ncbi:MAG TPA: hypothetical protein VGF28_06105 [Thermoanaerobaculia bacterium]|jgi:hypothetical protein
MKALIGTFLAVIAVACSAVAEPRPWVNKTYTGAVEIRRNAASTDSLIIAIDTVRGNARDGVADTAYVFYTATPAADVQFHAERAHVEDIGGRQLVIMAGERKVIFALAGEEIRNRAEGALTFSDGAGIARHWGDEVSLLRVGSGEPTAQVGCDGDGSSEPCYSDWSVGGGGGGGRCDSGGPGATSCSIEAQVWSSGGSCSVSCGPGYYACCSYSANCRCIRY